MTVPVLSVPGGNNGQPMLRNRTALVQTVFTIKGPGETGPGCPFFILEVPG